MHDAITLFFVDSNRDVNKSVVAMKELAMFMIVVNDNLEGDRRVLAIVISIKLMIPFNRRGVVSYKNK